MKNCISRGLLCRPFHLFNHFLDVEGGGGEGKVHSDLVRAEVTEALVLHVVFHLPEDSLRLYGPLGEVFESLLRCEPVPCLLFVLYEPVVGLNLPTAMPAAGPAPASC